jgi:hypothetical protein
MKKLAIAVSVMICIGIALAAGLSAQNAGPVAPAAPAERWQHMALGTDIGERISDPGLSRQINRLGDEGWELVDVENITRNGTTTKTVYFFKKRK